MQRANWFISKLRNPIAPLRRWIVRHIAARQGPRALLNRYYGLLDDRGKVRFDQRYSKIFRGHGLLGRPGVQMAPGEWRIRFLERDVQLPLRPEWAWLDWDHAVSTLGNDNEVVQTYAALIRSRQRPALFMDVGANYGMHSVLFSAVGIPVIAFEPNPTCQPLFQTVCGMNNLAARWEQVAIGSSAGQIELVYPEKDPWLGSVAADVIPGLAGFENVVRQQVSMRTLDDYLVDLPPGNVLIKIDVEGYEAEVIRGASRLLRERAPSLVFESNDVGSRDELFQVIAERGYVVHPLPWGPSVPGVALDAGAFHGSAATNFIAVPLRT